MTIEKHSITHKYDNSLCSDREKTKSTIAAARKMAENLPLSFCSTIVINGNCNADPPCRHCRWRSAASSKPGFRKIQELPEILQKAEKIKKAGIQRILLLSGWMGEELPNYFYQDITAIKDATGLELCGGFGYLSQNSVSRLKSAGLDSYFCGLEMASEELFKQIRPGDNFQSRIQTVNYCHDNGLKVWSGFIFGAGETQDDIYSAFQMLVTLKPDVLYINPLFPAPHTEMENCVSPDLHQWAHVLAYARTIFSNQDILTKPEFAPWAFSSGASAFVHAPPEITAIEKLKQTVLDIRMNPIEIKIL